MMNTEPTDPVVPSEAQPPSQDGPRSAVTNRADFAASLDSFQGPLDLLLYLIKENEVEITGIPIAQILHQFLQFLDAASEWDLQLAGEFLVMATTLMEIKSRELLPVQEAVDGEEIIEDPRSELVRKLLRYRDVKEQAKGLEQHLERWEMRRPRGMFDEIPEAPEDTSADAPPLADFDLYELFAAFERIQRAVLAQTPRSVTYEGESVEQKIERIEKILKERPFAPFAELVSDPSSRGDIAMTFVALLELVRRRMIRLLQDKDFGNIGVKVQTAEEAEALAQEESEAAGQVVDAALRERAEREAKLAAEAAALGVAVDQLPWKKRRAALSKPKFEGIIRPEDLEEIDTEEAEISRRIDAILAAADAISQRFEDGKAGEPAADPAATAALAAANPQPPAPAVEPPVTEEDLAPKPEPDPAVPPPNDPKHP